jgi:guanylate kinase
VGKGTVVEAVRRRHPHIWISVSVTTRAPRPGEIDGVQYHFVTRARYDELVAADALLEHAEFAGNGYGTPRAPVEERMAAGAPTLLEIDLQGARQVRARAADTQLVFLLPPSRRALEYRLRSRGTEDAAIVRTRLERAEEELAAVDEFDAVVVNDDVERAAAELVRLIDGARP